MRAKRKESLNQITATITRTKSQASRSISGLVTHSQNALSSQATVYTDQSRNKSGTQRSEMDEIDDLVIEQIDTLFITAEEERKIHSILELTKNGKININNAFDVPVMVVDAHNNDTVSMRFWKFSSELLDASLNIYGKRVENLYLVTNKVLNNLSHISSTNQELRSREEMSEEQKQQLDRNKKTELIKLSIEEFNRSNSNPLGKYEIGTENCQSPDRLDIKNLNSQFMVDPTFSKKLKAFDSESYRYLFLNIFECGAQLEIQFFNKDKRQSDTALDTVLAQKDSHQSQESNTQSQNYSSITAQNTFPEFIAAELPKMGFISKNNHMFSQLTHFTTDVFQAIKQKYLPKNHSSVDGLQDNSEVPELNTQFFDEFIQKTNQFEYQDNDNLGSENNKQFGDQNLDNSQAESLHNGTESMSQHAQSLNIRIGQMTIQGSESYQNTLHQSFLGVHEGEDIQHYQTVITPWEMQLKKKKVKKQTKSLTLTENKKLKPEQELEIDFNPEENLQESDVFKPVRESNKSESKNVRKETVEKNLLPKSLDAYERYHFRKRRQKMITTANSLGQKAQNPLMNQMDEQYFAADIQSSFGKKQKINEDLETQYFEPPANESQVNQEYEGLSTEGLVYFQATGLKNVREIKKSIFEEVKKKGSLRLGEINIGISRQSVMIIFLHLVNEKQLAIDQLDQEGDLLLKIPELEIL